MYRRTMIAASVLALAGCTQPRPPPSLVVFFTADSAALDAQAQSAVKQAAALAQANPSAPVQVLGFAANDTGTTAFNKALSQARAQAVADALITAGVAQNRIRVGARGATTYEAIPTEARRVEIVVGS